MDWAVFKKRYGVRVAITEREGEEQMGVVEHAEYWEGKNNNPAWIENHWNTLLANTKDEDKDGTGADLKLWVPLRKQRFKDRTRFLESGVDTSTKAEKNISDQDLEAALKTVESSTSFAESWMQSAVPDAMQQKKLPSSSQASGATEQQAATATTEEVIFMAPSAVKKHQFDLPNLVEEMKKTIDAGLAALQASDTHKANFGGEDVLLDDYVLTLRVRLHLSHVWMAGSPGYPVELEDSKFKPVAALMVKTIAKSGGPPQSPTNQLFAESHKEGGAGDGASEGPDGAAEEEDGRHFGGRSAAKGEPRD